MQVDYGFIVKFEQNYLATVIPFSMSQKNTKTANGQPQKPHFFLFKFLITFFFQEIYLLVPRLPFLLATSIYFLTSTTYNSDQKNQS